MISINSLLSSDKLNPNIRNNFKNIIGDKKIVLYGAGSGFITFSMFVLEKYGYKAELIIDNRFSEKTHFHGSPAKSIDHIKVNDPIVKNCIVVITLGNLELHKNVTSSLREKGFDQIISAFDVYEYHLSHSKSELNEVSKDYYLKRASEIQAANDLFLDERSKNIFIHNSHLKLNYFVYSLKNSFLNFYLIPFYILFY